MIRIIVFLLVISFPFAIFAEDISQEEQDLALSYTEETGTSNILLRFLFSVGQDQGSATAELGFGLEYHCEQFAIFTSSDIQFLENDGFDWNSQVSVGAYLCDWIDLFFTWKGKYAKVNEDEWDFHSIIQPSFTSRFIQGENYSLGLFGYIQIPITPTREHQDGLSIIKTKPQMMFTIGGSFGYAFDRKFFLEGLNFSSGVNVYEMEHLNRVGSETILSLKFRNIPVDVTWTFLLQPSRDHRQKITTLAKFGISIPLGASRKQKSFHSTEQNVVASNDKHHDKLKSEYAARSRPIHMDRELFLETRTITQNSSDPGPGSPNQAPQITSWTRTSDPIFAGDIVTFEVTATDPEGKAITVKISHNGSGSGAFLSPTIVIIPSGGTATFQYQTVGSTPNLLITTMVNDEEGETDSRTDNVGVG